MHSLRPFSSAWRVAEKSFNERLKSFSRCLVFILLNCLPKILNAAPLLTTRHSEDFAVPLLGEDVKVATPQETYLRGGRFDKDATLTLIQEALKTGATLGFPLTRLIAHAETVLWHPEDWSSVNEWIEYETRLNDVLPRYNDPVICTYDANLLNGSIAVDILRTHPVAIIGGLLYENPFFVPPQEFLRQIRQRSGAPPKAYRG